LYFVYVLNSDKDNKRYIGFTENLDKRVVEHNSGLVKSTKNRRPFKLTYFEEYVGKEKALKREKFFKSGLGRSYLKNISK